MMRSNDYHYYVPKNQRKQKIVRIGIEIIIAALLIALAITASVVLKKFISKKILDQVQLRPNASSFESWLNPPITTTRTYYLFNITNPLDIVTDPKSATINFTDTPPYIYNLKTFKTNVQWTNDNTRINYAVEKLFTRHKTRFNSSSVNDTGVFVNLLRASFRTQFQNKPTQAFYAIVEKNPFYQRNALEQLEGFDSDLFRTLRDKMIGPNTDKYGFVYRQNGSRLYNVSITVDSMKKGQLLTFANELVPFQIKSSSDYPFPVYDGLTYPPMLFDKPNLNIFNSDFCKPVLIQFNREVSKFGINVHEYKLKLIDYNNCTNPSDASTCNEVNKLDVSKCISDSLPENTIFLSKAHFYGSNDETIKALNVEGFTPEKDKHDSVIYFEPYSGTPLKVLLRIQVNVNATIDPMKESDDDPEGLQPVNKNGIKRLIPVFWIDQEIDISEEVIKKLQTPLRIIKYGRYVILLFAIVLAAIIIGISELVARRSAKNARYSRGIYQKAGTTIQ